MFCETSRDNEVQYTGVNELLHFHLLFYFVSRWRLSTSILMFQACAISPWSSKTGLYIYWYARKFTVDLDGVSEFSFIPNIGLYLIAMKYPWFSMFSHPFSWLPTWRLANKTSISWFHINGIHKNGWSNYVMSLCRLALMFGWMWIRWVGGLLTLVLPTL